MRFPGILFSRRGLLVLAALVSFALAGAAWGLFADLPAPDTLLTRTSPDTTKIFDRNGKLLYEILDPLAGRRTRVPLGDLPANFKNAVISVEDSSFYENPGVDAAGIARAVVQYAQEGQIVSGGSTLTQQLARQVLLTREEKESRTVTRKLREMLLALRITQTYSKDQILEMYLNEIYFGNLAYGVEAAAQTYFGKPARDLDLAESAMLAGFIQSPAAYDPYVNFDAARARQRVVLDLMVKHNALTGSDAQLAGEESLHFAATDKRDLIRAPHFVAYVRNLLELEYGADFVNRGGLSVTTTLDLNVQERAQEIVRRHIDELKNRTRNENAPDYNLNDAALVALKPDSGEILAMVGSADYFDASIDGAVNVALALRQPGSSIKPVTYATAFSRDYTPATVLSDVPTTFQTKEHEPYAPQNFDRQWHGPLSLRSALASSNNMIAVKVLEHVGLPAMIDTAKALGVSTFDDPDRFGLALTLGGGEVKLLELTAAYAAFANQGIRVEPRAILQITAEGERRKDETRSDFHSSPFILHPSSEAVSPQVAYLITSILTDDYARIPAFGEDSVLKLSRPAAAKTGTTTDFRDNWTVGYTPHLAVGVWAGNADNAPMYRVTGVTGAGPIWHDVMEDALRGIPAKNFVVPNGLVEREICDASGLLATPDCPRVRREIFIRGTEPTQRDNAYQALFVDAPTGKLWTDGCQGPRVRRVFRFYPPDAQDWAKKMNLPLPPEVDCLGRLQTTDNAQEDPGMTGPSDSARRPSLEIVSPAQNAEYLTSPQLPASAQQIEVSARLNSAVKLNRVTLYVDDIAIATFSGVPYRALWQLKPGAHTARAAGVTLDGQTIQSDPVRFVVQSDTDTNNQ